jgi:hypothetical protein
VSDRYYERDTLYWICFVFIVAAAILAGLAVGWTLVWLWGTLT